MDVKEDLKEDLGSGEKKEVVITDCPVQTVVVYPDRAEVGGATIKQSHAYKTNTSVQWGKARQAYGCNHDKGGARDDDRSKRVGLVTKGWG